MLSLVYVVRCLYIGLSLIHNKNGNNLQNENILANKVNIKMEISSQRKYYYNIPVSHQIAISSRCWQLWTPHPLCEHVPIFVSVPVQRTSSNQICPLDAVKFLLSILCPVFPSLTRTTAFNKQLGKAVTGRHCNLKAARCRASRSGLFLAILYCALQNDWGPLKWSYRSREPFTAN